MDISKLTLGECREIASLLNGKTPVTCACDNQHSAGHPYEIGEDYFIRTVTHHFTGKLVAVHTGELVLTKAAWIPDDGRFHEAVTKGTFKEVEPFPPTAEVIINRASVVDALKIGFELPVSQK